MAFPVSHINRLFSLSHALTLNSKQTIYNVILISAVPKINPTPQAMNRWLKISIKGICIYDFTVFWTGVLLWVIIMIDKPVLSIVKSTTEIIIAYSFTFMLHMHK